MRRLLLSVIVFFTTMMAGSAFAAYTNTAYPDATLSFTGTFLANTCDVDAGSQNLLVDLESAPVVNFPAVGSTQNATAFNVNLVDCVPGTKVTMTVAGTMDTVSSVLQSTGTATNVGIQLLQAASVGATTGTPLVLNSAINMGAVGSSSTTMTIPLVAQFYRLGTMTAGTVVATATVNFTYN